MFSQIAVVSQDCLLFARPIRENIKYGYEDASEEEIYRAARLAGAHEFITNLTNGYDTGVNQPLLNESSFQSIRCRKFPSKKG